MNSLVYLPAAAGEAPHRIFNCKWFPSMLSNIRPRAKTNQNHVRTKCAPLLLNIPAPPHTRTTRCHATRPGADCVLAVSSGGTIGRLVAACLQAPDDVMITLNLQIKNTSITRFIFNDKGRFYLHEFNATPHFLNSDAARHLTYS